MKLLKSFFDGLRKLHFYIKYPNLFLSDIKFRFRINSAQSKNINFFKPNYLYLNKLTRDSRIIDVGCGRDAEMSRYFIDKFGLNAVVVDPTRKHQHSLAAIKSIYGDKFNILNYALSSTDGQITFNESITNESGSIMAEHINVRDGGTISYEVQTISLKSLAEELGNSKIDFIKIDIEGAEFDLIENLTASDLSAYDQIFIEFHHRTVRKYTRRHKLEAVNKLKEFGYKVFTLDDINYLFYRA